MSSINPSSTQRRSVLTLLNTVMGEMGMPPISGVTSSDEMAVQLVYLANRAGSNLSLLPLWPELIETATITFVTDQASYDLPADWGTPLANTVWDRTTSWPVLGPTVPSTWQALQSGIGTAGPRYRYRFRDLKVEFYPTPTADGEEIVLDYQSRGWVLGLNGALNDQRKPRITADTDYIVLNEELFILAVIATWKRAKGLDASTAIDDLKGMLESAWASSNGFSRLSMAPSCDEDPFFLSIANIPETGYGP